MNKSVFAAVAACFVLASCGPAVDPEKISAEEKEEAAKPLMTKDQRLLVPAPDAQRSASMRQDEKIVYQMQVYNDLTRADMKKMPDGSAKVWFKDYVRLPKLENPEEKAKDDFCVLTFMKDTYSLRGSSRYLMTKVEFMPRQGDTSPTSITLTDENNTFSFKCVKSLATKEWAKMTAEEQAAEQIISMDEISRIAGNETDFAEYKIVE